MVYVTDVGAVKGVALSFLQLILAVVRTPLGHGAVMKQRYISAAFGQGAALDLVQSKVVISLGIVLERNCIRRVPNRPCGSMTIEYRMMSFRTSSPIAWSRSIIEPVTASFLRFRINFNLSLSCKCASAAALKVSTHSIG